MESRVLATVARPKSAMHAWPESFTSMFSWWYVNMVVERRFRTTTYSLEVPMDDIAGMEVAEALGDV
jgi:hypothetical protein